MWCAGSDAFVLAVRSHRTVQKRVAPWQEKYITLGLVMECSFCGDNSILILFSMTLCFVKNERDRKKLMCGIVSISCEVYSLEQRSALQ